MNFVSPVKRIHRVRHELKRRAVTVARTETLGSHFISVTFAGEALHDFKSESFDDHCKFIFATTAGETVSRDYTPRRFDRERRELTIEFVVHGDGDACQWARRAAPGVEATIGGPKGSMIIPTDFPWHLLIGDSTALPAIHRRLEELPADTQAFVLIQPSHPDDRRELRSAARLDLRWLAPQDDLVAQVAALSLPASEGFAWGAGEAATMARVRDALVDKQQPREAMRIAAYWKQGAGSFHETL